MQRDESRPDLIFLLSILLTNLVFFLPSSLQGAPPSQKSPKELVQQLGDSSFNARIEAFQELKALKASAIPALKNGLNSKNPEISQRCRELLKSAQESDLERQLRLFVKSGNRGKLAPLPGWKAFSKKLGDSYRARDLYVAIYLSEPNLFPKLDQNPKQLTKSLQNRVKQLYSKLSSRNSTKQTRITFAQVGTVLYISSFTSGLDRNTFRYFYSFFSRQEVKTFVEGEPLFRQLMSSLLMNQPSSSSTYSYRLNLAQNYQLLPVIRKKILPEIEKQLDQVLKNPSNLSRLQSTVRQIDQLGLNDLAEKKIKPFIKKQAKILAERGGDYRTLQYMVYSANVLKMQKTMTRFLKPAFYKVIQQYRNDNSKYSQIYSLVSVARTLDEESALVDFLRPALRQKMVEVSRNPNETILNRLRSDARYLGMQKEFDVFLKPAARKVVLNYLEKGTNLENIQKAYNVANRFQMAEIKQKTFRPLLERLLDDSKNARIDMNKLYQIYSLTRSLGPVAAIEKKIKPLAIRTFEDLAKRSLNTSTLSRALSLGEQLQIKEAIPLALKAAKQRSLSSYYRARSIQFVGKLGEKEQIAQLLPLLKDSGRVSTTRINNTTLNTQIRDVALASIIHLSGQKISEYGFDYARLTNREFLNISYNCYGFSNAQKRGEALKKWQEWKEKQNK